MLAATDSHARSRSALLIVLLALASAGCASPGASWGNASESASLSAVTGEELRQVSARDTYEALKQLRPIWLLPRGRSSLVYYLAGIPVVYVAGVPHGPVSSLRGIEVGDVQQVDFMNAIDAGIRYGTGHSGGMIFVDLR